MQNEVKPCPFCGGLPELDALQSFRNFRSNIVEYRASIDCPKCGASMSLCYSDAPTVPEDDVVEMVRDLWNTRPDLPRLPTSMGEEVTITPELREALHAARMASVELIPDPQIAALQSKLDILRAATVALLAKAPCYEGHGTVTIHQQLVRDLQSALAAIGDE